MFLSFIAMFFIGRIRGLVTRIAKFLLVNSVLLSMLMSALLFISVVSYALFYMSYIPTVQLVRPVHFKYAMRPCKLNEMCQHPVATVPLSVDGSLSPVLSRNTEYRIVLEMEMPESEANFEAGMFMVSLDMKSTDGEVLSNAQRSGVLIYRSEMLRIFNTLFYLPTLIWGSSHEKQVVRLDMFERYVEEYSKYTWVAQLEVHSPTVQIYTAQIKIFADFSGLRYMMYHWPLTTAVVGISFNFCVLLLLAGTVWVWYRLPVLRRTLGKSIKEQDKGDLKNVPDVVPNGTVVKTKVVDEEPEKLANKPDLDQDEVKDVTDERAIQNSLAKSLLGLDLLENPRAWIVYFVETGLRWSPVPKSISNILIGIIAPPQTPKNKLD